MKLTFSGFSYASDQIEMDPLVLIMNMWPEKLLAMQLWKSKELENEVDEGWRNFDCQRNLEPTVYFETVFSKDLVRFIPMKVWICLVYFIAQ